jgi:hypothetical protein
MKLIIVKLLILLINIYKVCNNNEINNSEVLINIYKVCNNNEINNSEVLINIF